MSSEQPRSKAPFVVYGGILLIAVASVAAVLIGHCRRDEPYLDPEEIRPGEPGRVYPTVDPSETAPSRAPPSGAPPKADPPGD